LQTVLVNVAELVARREYPYRSEWLPHDRYNEISAADAATGWQRLKPIKELLSVEITYGEIRLVAAHRRAQAAQYRAAAGL
jgi:helix-turn-helix protein